MLYVNNWVLAAALFLVSIVSFVLLFKENNGFAPRKLLGIAFIALVWYGITYLILNTGKLIEYPFIYRIGCPLFYLIPPCFYLYIRSTLNGTDRYRSRDLLHFIPVILALIDISAYYFGMSAEEKMAEIVRVQKSPILVFDTGAGFLPAISHFYFRSIQSIIYLFVQWRLIIYTRKRLSAGVNWKWILMLSLFETFMYAGNLALTVFGIFREEMTLVPVLARSFQFTIVLMMVSLVIISYYMLFRPELLYGSGFRPSKASESAVLPETPSEPQVVVQPKTEYCEKLELYLAEQKPFLRKRLTLSDLSAELDLPAYVLSGLLNNHYRQNFNDFINDYRIEHVIERMSSGSEWRSLSMEGLALECGFSSRTAFYTAFKKRKNMSPGAFAASLDEVDGRSDKL